MQTIADAIATVQLGTFFGRIDFFSGPFDVLPMPPLFFRACIRMPNNIYFLRRFAAADADFSRVQFKIRFPGHSGTVGRCRQSFLRAHTRSAENLAGPHVIT